MTVQHQFNREELLSCARGELFGLGNAQLPMPPMLMFDRIVHISEEGGEYGKGEVVAEYDLNPDLWFFQCHFVGDPVMPGCLGADALWQLVGFYLGWSGGRVMVARWGQESSGLPGKSRRIAKNGLSSVYKTNADGKVIYRYCGRNCRVDDREIYPGKDLRVGLFKELESL
ncbi:MAG: 3-hydroxydecanoyl-[acyl-carrier-protein] dehydratase [Gammaproteobacteria bacterium]|nr:MAG: 3-hydroxydecanoyl-[acyl-carrier-protein] dehydratase [Gammaproteobacteria bacterium]